jgi:hypothetical protein
MKSTTFFNPTTFENSLIKKEYYKININNKKIE